MTNSAKIVVLMLDAPYTTIFLPQKFSIVEHLAEMASDLVLFHYMDGIHQGNDSQFSQNMPNIMKILERLHQDFPKIKFFVCSRCTAARGYLNLEKSNFELQYFVPHKLLPFFEVVSIYKLGEFRENGFRIIQI